MNTHRQGKARQVYLYSTFQHKVIQSALHKHMKKQGTNKNSIKKRQDRKEGKHNTFKKKPVELSPPALI